MKKGVGGLKDILECQMQNSEEQTMVEIELIINGKRKRISIGKFKELLFGENKKPESNDLNIINGEDVYNYIEEYGKLMCDEFIEYWTETTTRGNRHKWKTEKTFKVGRRIKQWARRDYNGLYSDYCIEKRKKEDLEKERQASKDSNPEEFGKFIRNIYKETTRKMSINEEV